MRQLTAQQIDDAQAVALAYMRQWTDARLANREPINFADFAAEKGLAGPALLYAQGLVESAVRR